MNTPQLYVLMKGGYYYRPEAKGYTADPTEAWRVQKNEAEFHCNSSHGEVTMHEVTEPWPMVGQLVTLEDLERAHIRAITSKVDNLDHAARILGIDIATLYRKRVRYKMPLRMSEPKR